MTPHISYPEEDKGVTENFKAIKKMLTFMRWRLSHRGRTDKENMWVSEVALAKGTRIPRPIVKAILNGANEDTIREMELKKEQRKLKELHIKYLTSNATLIE